MVACPLEGLVMQAFNNHQTSKCYQPIARTDLSAGPYSAPREHLGYGERVDLSLSNPA
jgi:hypothetical protein